MNRKRKYFIIAVALIVFGLVFALFIQNQFKLLGFTISEDYSQETNLNFKESSSFEWTPPVEGQLVSIKISGNIKGTGKISIENKTIFNSNDSTFTEDVIFSQLTGKTIEEEVVDKEETTKEEPIAKEDNKKEETTDKTIPEDSTEEQPTEEIIEEEPTKEILEEQPAEEIIEEEPTKEILENDSVTNTKKEENNNKELEQNITKIEDEKQNITTNNISSSNENITTNKTLVETENKTLDQIKNKTEEKENKTENKTKEEEIKIQHFNKACLDSCNLLELNLTKESYTIDIEIYGEIEITSIEYKINPKEENKTENKTKEEIIAEDEIEVITTQFQAVVGQPVKWKKEIKIEKAGLAKIDLPKEAKKIKINKKEINKTEPTPPKLSITGNVVSNQSSFLSFLKKIFGRITGKAIEIENKLDIIIENETETYEIEYETNGPTKEEKEISPSEIEIKITNNGSIHLKNVLSFTNLSTELEEGDFTLYSIINDTKKRVPTTNYDKNENGKIDYIEWIVPQLSEVIYVLDLTILNIESSVEIGDQWIVQFHTIGTDTLRIAGVGGTDIKNDLQLKEISCGGTPKTINWKWGNVNMRKYSCNVNSIAVFDILTDPPHQIEFSFRGITEIATTKSKGTITTKEDFQETLPSGIEDYPGTTGCNWLRNQEYDGTPSSSTGPEIDHTTGSIANGGRFLFIETSSGYCNQNLDSAEFSINKNIENNSELKFWYHMYGSDTGTLEVYINGIKEYSIFGQQQFSGTDDFKLATIDLSSYSGEINITFKGIAIGGWQGDISIDDIEIISKSPDSNSPPTTPLDIYCDNYPNCDIDVLENVIISAKGSLDSENDNIEYQIEANLFVEETTKISTNKELIPTTPPQIPITATSCSNFWNNNCATGPPENFDNTFDSCDYGNGQDESVTNIYLTKSSVTPGETLTATCEFDPYDSGDYTSIWYYDTNTWTKLYEHKNWGSAQIINESVNFITSNIEGTHYIRCSISYGEDADNCADSTSWNDNDDLGFIVKSSNTIIDSETEFEEYSLPTKEYEEIISINILTEISEYNAKASIGTSGKPDLELEAFNGNDWISIGTLNIANTYTGSGIQTYKTNISKEIILPSILDSWRLKENQKIRIKGVLLDKNQKGEDKIKYDNIYISINSKDWVPIGTHIQEESFNWNVLLEKSQNCINLKAKSIDKNGSNKWSPYFEKNSCLNIIKTAPSGNVQIQKIITPATINPIEGSTVSFQIYAEVYASKIRNLRAGFVNAKLIHADKEIDLGSCIESNQIDSNTINYSCSATLESIDPSGKWVILVKAQDSKGNFATNGDNFFQYNLLRSLEISPNIISFDLTTTGKNQKANTKTIIRNKGNYDASNHVLIHSTKLFGQIYLEEFIPAEVFTVSTADNCVGTNLATNIDTKIQNITLPIASEEELYYCIPTISGISTQQYSTSKESWIIKLD